MGAPLERFDDLPKRVENETTIVLGQRKLFQRLVPGPRARVHLLGLRRPLPDDPDRGDLRRRPRARGSPPARRSPGSRARAGSRSSSTSSAPRARRRRGRVLDPQGAAAAAVRGQPPRRGRPHPRPHRRDRRHAPLLARDARSRSASTSGRPRGRRSRTPSPASSATHVDRGARARLRLGPRAHHPLLPRLPAVLEAPAHRDRRPERLLRTHARGRTSRAARFDAPDEEIRFGAGTVSDITWKGILDTMSCTECGRCQDVCPAYATGKELSPKLLIMDLRDHVFAEGPQVLARRRVQRDARSSRTRSPTRSCGTA